MPKLLFLDLETTGLDTDTCDIIEVAYSANGGIGKMLHKPANPIPFEISGITNIDNCDVENCEPFLGSFSDIDLSRYPKMGYIAVTHNTDFDLEVLANHGINFEESICTYKLAWKLLPELPNHKLGTLRAYFGIPHGDGVAHRADYDVQILEQVYKKLWFLAKMDEQDTENKAIRSFVELSDQAKKEYLEVWHFGKHKGEKISVGIHKSYINWLLGSNQNLDKKLKNYLENLIQ